MNQVTDATKFEKQLLRNTILHVLRDAIACVEEISDEGYFAEQNLSKYAMRACVKNARAALYATWKSIDDEPLSVDMNIRHFFPGNKTTTPFHEKIGYELHLVVFNRHNMTCVSDILNCSQNQFELLSHDCKKYKIQIPLAFLAVYRASR